MIPSFHPDNSLSLRPQCAEDDSFLLEVYSSTREEELERTGWDAATRSAFLKMQFNAMQQGYAAMFPHGQFNIILLHNQPIGRFVVARADHEIRVVDIALLPSSRGKGVGTFLLQQLLREGRQAGKPVRLHVLKNSRAARHYLRLGFLKTGEEGPYDQMESRLSV